MNPIEDVCKICFDPGTAGDPLLQPCFCTGSLAFVHNSCLLKWLNICPSRGLNCTVCLADLAIEYSYPLERIPEVSHFDIQIFYRPFFLICCSHALFFFYCLCAPPHVATSEGFFTAYKWFQVILHYIYFSYGLKTFAIQNKKLYMMRWLTAPRIAFLFSHGLLLWSLPITGYAGGVIENFIITYYYHEHFEILHEINSLNKMCFKSRCQSSSYEESSF